VPGFNYSAALKAKGGTWTVEALNTWLTDPRADVPGTAMTFAGLPNEKQRADLIAYLNTLSANPKPLPTAQKEGGAPGGQPAPAAPAVPAVPAVPAQPNAQGSAPAPKQ
jgi:cytochrome c